MIIMMLIIDIVRMISIMMKMMSKPKMTNVLKTLKTANAEVTRS